MKKYLAQLWREEDGVMTFEWITLLSLMTVGVVGGLAVSRDAVVDELADVAEAMVSLDQSYNIAPPPAIQVHNRQAATVQQFNSATGSTVRVGNLGSGASSSSFKDSTPEIDRSQLQPEEGQDDAAEQTQSL